MSTPSSSSARRALLLLVTALALIAYGLSAAPAAHADGYPPSAPLSVSATAGAGEATVTWLAPTNGGSHLLYYNVYAYDPEGNEVASAFTWYTQRTAVVGPLTNGTGYTFKVIATAGTLNDPTFYDGPASAASNSVVPTNTPSAPSNVAAEGYTVNGDGRATLSWTTPSFNGNAAITSYDLIASPGGAVTNVAAGTTNPTVSGLSIGTEYTFTVKARNAAGGISNASSPSNPITLTNYPGAPLSVTAATGAGQATVSWQAPISSGIHLLYYNVYAYDEAGNEVSSEFTWYSQRSVVIGGLVNGSLYRFKVVATAGTLNNPTFYEGPASAPSNWVTPTNTPNPVTNVQASPLTVNGDGRARLTWDEPSFTGFSSITSYEVTASPGGAVTTVAAGLGYPPEIGGLAVGTAYTFTVKAINASGGKSAASDPSNAVTPTNYPGAPQLVQAVAGDGQATVNWVAPYATGSNLLYYMVYAYDSTGTQVDDEFVWSSTTSLTFPGLTNGVAYRFKVQAVSGPLSGPYYEGPLSGFSVAVTPHS